jgi:hypothetical protein
MSMLNHPSFLALAKFSFHGLHCFLSTSATRI